MKDHIKFILVSMTGDISCTSFDVCNGTIRVVRGAGETAVKSPAVLRLDELTTSNHVTL